MNFITAEWFGIEIIRPNNLITNVLVGVFGYFFYRLTSKKNEQQLAWINWWGLFFLFVGLGTAIGGFAHAFNYNYPRIKHTVWDHFAWVTAGIGLYFGEKTRSVWDNSNGSWVLKLAAVKLFLFVMLMIVLAFQHFSGINNFDVVRWNATLSMLILLATTYFWVYRTRRSSSWLFFLAGFGVLLAGVPVYNFELRFHDWFDHHDIGHCLQIVAFWLFYLGIVKETSSNDIQAAKYLAE